MKLYELFDYKTFPDEFDEIDSRFNREAQQRKREMERYYKKTGMDSEMSTPVFKKPKPAEDDEIWTTDPENPGDEQYTSSGYIGRENAKRRAGHKYDKDTPQSDPHSEVALSGAEQDIINKAERSLGRHLFK